MYNSALAESRRRWNCGSSGYTEWAYEGKPNVVLTLGATGTPPVIKGARMMVRGESAFV